MSNYNPSLIKSIIYFSISLLFFLLTITYLDFYDENNNLVRPFDTTNSYETGDYDFYNESYQKFSAGDFNIVNQLRRSLSVVFLSLNNDQDLSENFYTEFWVSGPILPYLYDIFGYFHKQKFIYVLYIFLLFIANHLWSLSLPNSRLVHFMIFFLPAPIFYTQHISSEIPYYFLFSIFYFLYNRFSFNKPFPDYFYLFLVTLLAGLLRPNVLNLIPVLMIFVVFVRFSFYSRLIFLLTLLITFILFFLYYYPYIMVSKIHSTQFTFFNESVESILSGSFGYIWGLLKLIFFKILYFTGVRPSYSHSFDLGQFVKLLPSIIFLIGFINSFFNGTKKDILLIIFISFPILYGTSQDRYNLILQPLLLYYGVKFILSLYRKIRYSK